MDMVKKCPECGGVNLSWNKEKGEITCKDCGLVIEDKMVEFGEIRVDLAAAAVTRNGNPIELSAREFKLLRYFIDNPGRVISREELLENVWEYDSSLLTRTVDVHVGLLRKKLCDDPKEPSYFVTVRGLGYRFQPG